MKKPLYFLVVSILITSCISISVGGIYNEYNKLTETQKENVVFLDVDESLEGLNNDGRVYSITGKQLKRELMKQDTSLVYFWSPHCESEICVLVGACQEYASQKNYRLYVVADYYDMDVMDAQNQAFFPMLIANHKYYETDIMNKCDKLFRIDLELNPPKKESYFRYHLFVKGEYVRSLRRIF